MRVLRVHKDHLKEYSGVTPVGTPLIEAPETGDPLVFWTQHPTHPVEVTLREFATGRGTKRGAGGPKFVAFSGRPDLICQLLPTLTATLSYASKATASNYLTTLRTWWRILDVVESTAANVGQKMTRVEDVRLLTQVHAEVAHRRRIRRTQFCIFRGMVDVTRLALGAKETYWESPEDDTHEKHIPPPDQRKALRISVKLRCRQVLERWNVCDDLKALNISPEDPERAKLWRIVRHMHLVQQTTGKAVPTTSELNNRNYRGWVREHTGAGVRLLRSTAFPDSRDANAVWTQCLINTPWNPSTLISLDVTQRFLFDHFKDDPADAHRRWVLIGQKERASGRDQFVFGMWKTLDGPGHLIKTYMDRVEPLRDVIKAELVAAENRYTEMRHEGTKLADMSKLFARIVSLKQGCRSVWLFVKSNGQIEWLREWSSQEAGCINGKQVSYLDEVRYHTNIQRGALGEKPIPKVSPKHFRVWYADYVYRSSMGSILAVKAALGHSTLLTTAGYVNTNVLNQEASGAARKLMEILLDELDRGRVDLTVLSHLYRYGRLTAEQEQQLARLRQLPKSREGVACKDAHNPPAYMKATPGEACDIQRCLLCAEHAVLLPESLDGIAMREIELRALQGFLPATTWVEDRYDIELENHKLALRRFELNEVIAARRKWSQLVASGAHRIPGIPAGEIVYTAGEA